jgi:hypothetical protein
LIQAGRAAEDSTLVLGAAGRVGRVLAARRVGGPRAAFVDVDALDVKEPVALARAARSHERWVHLASELRTAAVDPAAADAEAWRWRRSHVEMARRVLAAAVAGGVRQVVLASSVRAADQDAAGAGPDRLTHAGMNRAIEEAGREASRSGPDVACIRLGSVSWPDRPRSPDEALWLSHEDCAAAFAAVLASPPVGGRFTAFTAVSALAGTHPDTANPFGWQPHTRRVGWRRRAHGRVVDLKGRLLDSPLGPFLRECQRSGRRLVGS